MMNSPFLTKVTFPCNCVSWLLNAVVVVDTAFADLIAKRYDDDAMLIMTTTTKMIRKDDSTNPIESTSFFIITLHQMLLRDDNMSQHTFFHFYVNTWVFMNLVHMHMKKRGRSTMRILCSFALILSDDHLVHLRVIFCVMSEHTLMGYATYSHTLF